MKRVHMDNSAEEPEAKRLKMDENTESTEKVESQVDTNSGKEAQNKTDGQSAPPKYKKNKWGLETDSEGWITVPLENPLYVKYYRVTHSNSNFSLFIAFFTLISIME